MRQTRPLLLAVVFAALPAAQTSGEPSTDRATVNALQRLVGTNATVHYTEHFAIVSTAGAGAARDVGRRLEGVFAATKDLLKKIELPPRPLSTRVNVLVLSDQAAFERLRRPLGVPAGAIGYYEHSANRAVFYDLQTEPRLAELLAEVADAAARVRRRQQRIEARLNTYRRTQAELGIVIRTARIKTEEDEPDIGFDQSTFEFDDEGLQPADDELLRAELTRDLLTDPEYYQTLLDVAEQTRAQRRRVTAARRDVARAISQLKRSVVQHEGAHVAHLHLGLLPADASAPGWLSEGLAAAFETWRERGPDDVLTRNHPLRVRRFREHFPTAGDLPDLERIVGNTGAWHDTPARQTLAWSLVHYLAVEHPAEFARFLRSAATAPSDASSWEARFRDAFGAPDAVWARRLHALIMRLPTSDTG